MSPIASVDIHAIKPNGDRLIIEVRVGAPHQVDEDEWWCPVSMHPLFGRLHDAVGGSSLQSLCLAISLVLQLLGNFREDGGTLHYDDGTTFALEAYSITQSPPSGSAV
jgi:hypothetical protein